MRSIAAKFLGPLAILGLVFAGFLHYRSYATGREHMLDMVDQQAAIALEFNLAVREYVAETIRPIVTSLIGKDEFIPEAMSTSFVSRSVFEKVHAKFPDIIVKFGSDNPRNPINRATPQELRVIEYFNANPNVNKLASVVEIDGKEYQAYFSAKRMETSCLRCHGDPKDAPAALLARYGAEGSFHRPLGQVIALDTVAVPTGQMRAALVSRTARQSLISVGGLVVLLAGIALVFRQVVSRRLAAMGEHFRDIANHPAGSAITPVQVTGHDDIADLASSFNTLAQRLQQAYALLEERVAERTAELARANEELKREVAERQEAEQELQKAKAAAEAADRAKTEFLANMSHEIRTPMTAILGFAESLTDAQLSEAEKTDAIDTVRRNGEHLLQVINDILDLSKIEAGRMSVEQVAYSPFQIVEEVLSLMRIRAEAKGLALTAEWIGPLPETIRTDPMRVRQILLNLVGNAIKFTDRGGVRLVTKLADMAADVNHAPRSAALQFEVIDTGIGISPEQISLLFQPFAQADSSMTRRFGGSGLGLTISQRLAEMLGGTITAESRPGVGSTFRATVQTGPLEHTPLVDDPAENALVSSGRLPRLAPTQRLTGRVLLAEDGADNQRLIGFVLKKAGAEVTAVANGKLAVEVALAARDQGTPFDVILMDMQMPVLDGYAATRLLRSKGYRGPIIALTAHAMAADREKCLVAGCDDYASKPIDGATLVNIILTHLVPIPSR